MLSQTASDAVIVALRKTLTWADVIAWPVRRTQFASKLSPVHDAQRQVGY
jgi:hypothetical protein